MLVAAGLLAPSAHATWSVCVVNTETGEVCIAAATCLPNLDLAVFLPVVRVGIGVGAAQSLIDGGGNRIKIWNGLANGDSPDTILQLLLSTDTQWQQRQYGLVNMADAPATFTGAQAGPAKTGVVGTVGPLKYAIQGNVLAGNQVVLDAEAALLSTPGDLGQKVMAAMVAARADGGDGRCSCSVTFPDSCGVPPPGTWKSAHIGFFILARVGDADGTCDGTFGCATGSYYMNLSFVGGVNDQDPIPKLKQQHNQFRQAMVRRPDGIHSSAVPAAQSLVADGTTQTIVTVTLRDILGNQIPNGGAVLTVTPQAPGGPFAQPGPITDNGDGTYTFAVTAGSQGGTESFVVTADDGTVKATLYPFLEVPVDPLVAMHVGFDEVSAAAGASVPLVVNAGATRSGHPYLILGSASGTSPGFSLGTAGNVPLNPDPIMQVTLLHPGSVLLPGTVGLLDAQGRTEGALVAPPGVLAALVGLQLDWAAITFGAPQTITNPDGFVVVP